MRPGNMSPFTFKGITMTVVDDRIPNQRVRRTLEVSCHGYC